MKISDITGTACDGCKYYSVCKFSEENIIDAGDRSGAISRLSVLFSGEVDGSFIDSLLSTDVLPIKLQCKYMEKIPTSNVRSYEAACAAEGICP